MKKFLERQSVFDATLTFFSFFAKRTLFNRLTYFFTTVSARLNVALNKPKKTSDLETLAQTWQELMPPDGRQNFKITKIEDDTAYAEIHLKCPLRGTGAVHACHRLMNYDRQLMQSVGGQLIVLSSQSNSGNAYCRLAIRKAGEDVSDLQAAHEVGIGQMDN